MRGNSMGERKRRGKERRGRMEEKGKGEKGKDGREGERRETGGGAINRVWTQLGVRGEG